MGVLVESSAVCQVLCTVLPSARLVLAQSAPSCQIVSSVLSPSCMVLLLLQTPVVALSSLLVTPWMVLAQQTAKRKIVSPILSSPYVDFVGSQTPSIVFPTPVFVPPSRGQCQGRPAYHKCSRQEV